jgi:hypothetical protein
MGSGTTLRVESLFQDVSALNSGGSRTETGVGRHSASVVNAITEIPMNRSFQPTSPLQRWIFAAAAVLTTLATAGGIEGLITHYGTDAPLASAQHSRLAQR